MSVDLPIYVTENGMANADQVLNGTVNDRVREDYLFAHLDATRRAIADGANVKGFFYWSLLDNYEWAEGYEKRFGLVHVDFETLQRTPESILSRPCPRPRALDRPGAAAMSKAPLCLVADIGGTNTRVALADGTVLRQDSIRRFRNAEFPGLETVLSKYVAEAGITGIAGTCVAAAGPVKDQVATLTNRDWTIDHGTLTRPTGAAQGRHPERPSGARLCPRPYRAGQPAPPCRRRRRNQAARCWSSTSAPGSTPPRCTTPNGAASSPPANVAMSTCRSGPRPTCASPITSRPPTAFPGVEDVMSGRGLERLWGFVTTEAGAPSERSAAEIMTAIDDGTDPHALATARLFTRLLGAECGNLALIHLPFGGIYLVGGVARAFTEHLGPLGFAEAFRDKGRFAGFMQNFAVTILEDDYAPLTGCAAYLAQHMRG